MLVPTSQHVRTLKSARLAADVMGVPTLVVARTDSLGASLLTTDVDERDRRLVGEEPGRRGRRGTADPFALRSRGCSFGNRGNPGGVVRRAGIPGAGRSERAARAAGRHGTGWRRADRRGRVHRLVSLHDLQRLYRHQRADVSLQRRQAGGDRGYDGGHVQGAGPRSRSLSRALHSPGRAAHRRRHGNSRVDRTSGEVFLGCVLDAGCAAFRRPRSPWSASLRDPSKRSSPRSRASAPAARGPRARRAPSSRWPAHPRSRHRWR